MSKILFFCLALPIVFTSHDEVLYEEGNDVEFKCSAKGTPNPQIYWNIEGNSTLILPGTSWERFYASNISDGTTKLTLRNISKSDSDIYVVCSAVNLAGSAIISTRLLVTTVDERPPPIIVVVPYNQTLPHKSIAVLPCTGVGDPTPVMSWYYKGMPIISEGRIQVSEEGSLTIKDLNNDDSGAYTCVASSKTGKSIWTATLMVDAPTNPSVHFFRGPEESSLPGPPGKPKIDRVGTKSAKISWKQDNKIGSSSLLGYRVEMFGRDNTNNGRFEARWITVARGLKETSYTQSFVDSDVNCIFYVRAENSHGYSPPSQFSDPVIISREEDYYLKSSMTEAAKTAKIRHNLKSNDIVKFLEAIAIESTSAKLIWKVSIILV